MPTKTEAIAAILKHSTHADLSALYNANMECQVNVAQDGGELVAGDYQGRRWTGWTDGLTTWKAFRIPWNANTEPSYEDSDLKFDLQSHAEGIGMTGWDWKNRCSRWVAFDFDSITNHKTGLTPAELQAVKDAISNIPWVSIRASTSGSGIHVYAFLDPVVETANHTEHGALARAILGQLSALVGFDFQSKVDTCGGNMWVWHRKMKGTNGLTLLKQGIPLDKAPINWKDHIHVTASKKTRNMPSFITEAKTDEDIFEELCGQNTQVPLDDEHKKLIDFLKSTEALWWWDQDRHMLVCHTSDLKAAHTALAMRGIFETAATGKEHGQDQNCFAFPMRRGAWSIRRHTRGVQEHTTWDQDGNGWTRTYLNREPDFRAACRAFGGVEAENGGFVFKEAELAIRAATALGAYVQVPPRLNGRECILEVHKKDGRLICKIKHETSDPTEKMEDWLIKKDNWIRIFNVNTSGPAEAEIGNYDDLVRHLVTESGEDYGWLVNVGKQWRGEPLTHVKLALASMNFNPLEVTTITGTAVMRGWRMVNRPFQPEYPGNREWNRNAAQLRFSLNPDKDNLQFPTWKKILSHCGSGLDQAISESGWCKANGITSGSDYLQCWIASLIQEPLQPLPYLFMFGPQGSGKSIFHEALDLLITKGYQRADNALISSSGFNGELENAIICVVEETDLRKNQNAYNRIKDWVTSRHLNIRHLYQTPYHVPNSTHWIHCANDHNACPIFPGDTRITMMFVPALPPTDQIPKKTLILQLEKEAPDFLTAMMNLEIPKSNDRLNVPVVTTSEKTATQDQNRNELERFIDEYCFKIPGESIKFSEFFDKFIEFVDPNDVANWTKIRLGRELPPDCPRGRATWDNSQFHIGNISFTDVPPTKKKLIVREGFLRHIG